MSTEPDATADPLLAVEDLHVSFATSRGPLRAVQGVSFTLDQGKTLGIVGESGSGKTVLSRAVMGLLPMASTTQTGSVRYAGQEILNAPANQLRKLWSTHIAMVFQDPMTSLNPVQRIGNQIMEPLRIHLKLPKSEAKETALSLLMQVGIPSPVERFEAYPAQLSGGMRQRVMIAIALACAPRLLMADEPTTGLDVTVQAQILDLLGKLQHERNMSHDPGHPRPGRGGHPHRRDHRDVRRQRGGEGAHQRALQEHGHALHRGAAPLDAAPEQPEPHPAQRHRRAAARPAAPAGRLPLRPPLPLRPGQVPGREATAGRSRARPQLRLLVPAQRGGPHPRGGDGMTDTALDTPEVSTEPLLRVEDLHVTFRRGNTAVQAVAGISFSLRKGETLGLVGESGCGKSTTGRAIVQVERATSGTIRFGDTELTTLSRGDLRTLRTQVQMIFQDPISSLNPRRKVRDIVAEPLVIWKMGTKEERAAKANAMLDQVGIDPVANGSRRPREFSGGQCQRISIARALVLRPKLLVCDEIVSALDVSVQAQILNLLEDLKQELGLTVLFIAHDLAVVKNVSDRVAVMYLGRLCEIAPSDLLYQAPAHHYTAALLASAVEPDPEATRTSVALAGEPPSPINPPSGCRFRTRCPRAEARCAEEVPEMRELAPGHQVACHFPIGS